MQPNIEVVVHLIADTIVHKECGVFSSRELHRLAAELIVTDNPELALRRAIDQVVRVSPVAALKCKVVGMLVKHHNAMVAGRAA